MDEISDFGQNIHRSVGLHSFFIRNQVIRNRGSIDRNFKKLEGSVWVDLRNFQFSLLGNASRPGATRGVATLAPGLIFSQQKVDSSRLEVVSHILRNSVGKVGKSDICIPTLEIF